MKVVPIFLIIILTGCSVNEQHGNEASRDTVIAYDTPIIEEKKIEAGTEKPDSAKPSPYSNERFKDVTVERRGDSTFVVKGKAQIFEAQFSWVVEDGQEELKQGFSMTDAGAPEWGNFNFTVNVAKNRPNSTLHLILFESSPKDGSRQYELPVLLY